MKQHLAQQAGPRIEAAITGLRFRRHSEHVYDHAVGTYVATGRQVIAGWGQVPVQADGVLPDGRIFYFRFRGDVASLDTWSQDATFREGESMCDGIPLEKPSHRAVHANLTGDELGGDFTPDEAVDVFLELHRALAPQPDAGALPTYRVPTRDESFQRLCEALGVPAPHSS